MRICLDTNVFLQLFRRHTTFQTILAAWRAGTLTVLISTEILLEYEEAAINLYGPDRAARILRLFDQISASGGKLVKIEPKFRFGVITADADDNKFVDCAIAGGGEFVVTNDKHFHALEASGFDVRPLAPEALATLILTESE